MEPKTGYLDINGAKLYYEEMGAGDAVVFVHAGIADNRMWDDQFAVFAEKYRVIRFDNRGFGKSNAPKGPFSLHADIRGVMQALGVESAAVIGCSMGGMAVIDFALEYPDMARALVVVNGGISGEQFDGPPPPLWAEYEAAEKAGDFDLASDYAVRIWVDGRKRRPTEVDARIREKVREMTRISYNNPPDLSQYQEIDPPAASRLDQLHMPVLAVAGDMDDASVLFNMDQLAANAPNARKVVLRGTAHLPNMERPDDFNQVVLGFLAGAGG